MNSPIPGWALLCGLALTAVAASPASAQTYPERTVKIVVAYPPSGATDLLARVIAPHLTKTWGVPVIVENRPGASGNIGMELVA